MEMHDIILENSQFRLTLGVDCTVKSLLHLKSGRECAAFDEEIALFSVTQERPFHNEIKLIYMNKQTTFQANRVRAEGDKLIVGFEVVPYEAVVTVRISDTYIAFTLQEFQVDTVAYGGLMIELPPVLSFRLMQLPVQHMENFGQWLNVCWDDELAVNVLATSPYEAIDSEKNKHCRILTADARRDVKLLGTTAVLIVTEKDTLLDTVDTVEEDYDLPRGVKSRRNPITYASIYAGGGVRPHNIDEHIAWAQKGGFRLFRMYISSFIHDGYAGCGDYDNSGFREDYPNGIDDLKMIVGKIKAAGMIPGLHILHTFIGHKSHYITPEADPRVNIKRPFTLAKPLSETDTVVYVDRSTVGCPTIDRCKVLNFGGELIHYESFSTEEPCCFIGCERGHLNTNIKAHPAGLRGGLLDVSEFGGVSSYVDQNTNLQDELAKAQAKLYDCGFEFMYFDGSEGTNAPHEYHVPNAQYRVYKKLGKAPIFCEGAAKAHFSWHMLSGANGFDVFPTNVFKDMIDKWPVFEAQLMAKDFTRVNFGWWDIYSDTQPDTFEYGNSRALGWDCPIALLGAVEHIASCIRADDVFEVLRRWEDVREKNLLTAEQKVLLRKPGQEYTLLVNERGDYELTPYDLVENAAGGDKAVRVYVFMRGGESWATLWSPKGTAHVHLPLWKQDVDYIRDLGKEALPVEETVDGVNIEVGTKAYLRTKLPMEALLTALEAAAVLD